MTDTTTEVVYEGPSARADLSTVYYIDGHRLNLGVATPVPAALAKELLSGSDRTKGHKFSKPERQAAQGS